MIRVRQIEVNVLNDTKETILEKTANKLKINKSKIKDLKINKQSIDARKKPTIFHVYEVDIEVEDEDKILKYNKSNDIIKTPEEKYICNITGAKTIKNRPIIVGAGPAGLFAAYNLARFGYNPIIIERGEKVEERIKTVDNFWKTNKLNLNSNVQFGEGGAGTFSDGKLNTLVKDPDNRCKEVFKILVKNGANPNILYVNKPHIGTDLLCEVVKNIREEIISMGGTFKYNSCLTNIILKDNKVSQIEINNNEIIDTDILILAIGHSARDTFDMLYNLKMDMEAKPFAVGIRIQHPQSIINKSQYGVEKHSILENASYKLTYKASNNRGVYTFCMCPGGFVVNSSSEDNRIAINGMSYSKRDSENANSAILITIDPNDFGNNPLDGIKFQRELEEKAYHLGQGKIPVQLFNDYKEGKVSTSFKEVKPIFKGETNFANINDLFPEYINEALKEGILHFGTKIHGFAEGNAIIAAVESRTSSPVRLIRNELGESNINGIYPCGEGAGYAGGITSAAMDGLKTSENIMKIYKPQM